ncbi:MAG TPA: YiiX/YebB-like N1pC/P60 family cysteine hydrolase [Opitutaceae bacterium]|jgi:hypothetical protein|nr:YiiX/YebB-like N1pC/P60 family cysteine hydrolase [Opitutaceae bacterium]
MICRSWNALLPIACVALVLRSAAPGGPPASGRALATDPGLRAGDIVFTHEGGPIFSRVAAASNGWVSHVGILAGREHGIWMVAESRVPFSCLTPLPAFLARSSTGQYAIKRLNPPIDPRRVRRAIDGRLGRLYDFGFDLDAARTTFCSKFVCAVVRESTGRSVGEVETFRRLLTRNPGAPVGFWKVWFLGRIPWERRTVTPESLFESPLLTTVREGG